MKKKTVEECIRSRRSIRAFLPEKPPLEQVEELLRLAVMAPSGSNIQSWRFVVVTDDAIIRTLKAVSPGINGDPAYLIVFCSDKELAFEKGGPMGWGELSVMDVSMAAENFMLAANGMGLGTCAIKSFPDILIANYLKLPETIYPELIVSLGYPAQEVTGPKRIPIEEITYYNCWGGKRDET